MAGRAIPGRASAPGGAPEVAVRLGGALLALAVAAVHVADQGGITALASPHWIGWGYPLIEAGGVLTALTLLCFRPAWPVPTGLGWAAGVLPGAGPFAAYIASRTVGVPGDPGDVGNWGYWLGTVSLLVEAALVMLGTGMLLALRQRLSSAHQAVTVRPGMAAGTRPTQPGARSIRQGRVVTNPARRCTWRAPCGPAPRGRVGVTVVSPTPGAVAGVLRGQRHVFKSQIGTPISPARPCSRGVVLAVRS